MIRLSTLAALAPIVALLALAACDQRQMGEHGRYKPYEKSDELPGGREAQHPPPGTVARDDFIGPRAPKPKTTMALLRRGQALYNGICAPCHSRLGDGDGIVVRRGFPHPPTYHQARLRDAPDSHFYDVITDGYGLMYAYGNRVAPEDRWAVIAYIRALQVSQDSKLADLPADLRQRLGAGGKEAP
jgi:mono/diheme cytochrome c family protein